jgi:oxygen-independent coproporphyrinogen-3 oxidase
LPETGKLTAPVADWETKRRWVTYAFAECEKAGYTISSAYTAVKDPANTRFIYRDKLWAGADLLALGVSSFGHMNGVHYQNEHDFAPYLAALNQDNQPLYRALTPDADERLIREFILQMKLGKLDATYFTKKFGVDPLVRFKPQLDDLISAGHLRIDGTVLTFTRNALLQIDRLLHAFFLPKHANARYA